MADRDPPKFMYVRINRRCNLRCTHCTFWKLDDNDKPNYLTPAQRNALVQEFADIGGQKIVTCGGEPMLDTEDYFELMRGTHTAGLKCLSVVNGTKIQTQAMAERMIAEGPDEISISLDSHREEVHDRMRGVKNSFFQATNALRLLLAARAKLGIHKPIYAMTIVCEEVWRELDAFYDLVLNDIGADKLKLNIMQPSFGGTSVEDEFFGKQQVTDVEGLAAIIRACDAKYKLGINPVWLEQVKMYFRSVAKNRNALAGWRTTQGTDYPICNTYDRNIMVDLYGGARLCFNDGFPGMKLEKPGDLRKFWYEFSLPVRESMRSCTKYCGISHSVRRESATVRALPLIQQELPGS